MILTKNQLKITTECSPEGVETLFLSNLKDFPGINEKLRMFSLAELEPGGEVEFHIHENEFESYYIISGEGMYDDNGTVIPVEAGTVTYTPSGSGHGIKNTGKDKLRFIALIIRD